MRRAPPPTDAASKGSGNTGAVGGAGASPARMEQEPIEPDVRILQRRADAAEAEAEQLRTDNARLQELVRCRNPGRKHSCYLPAPSSPEPKRFSCGQRRCSGTHPMLPAKLAQHASDLEPRVPEGVPAGRPLQLVNDANDIGCSCAAPPADNRWRGRPAWPPQVNSKQSANVSICGYLSKYSGSGVGLLSQSWHSRFFTLNGTALQYYLTESDAGACTASLAFRMPGRGTDLRPVQRRWHCGWLCTSKQDRQIFAAALKRREPGLIAHCCSRCSGEQNQRFAHSARRPYANGCCWCFRVQFVCLPCAEVQAVTWLRRCDSATQQCELGWRTCFYNAAGPRSVP